MNQFNSGLPVIILKPVQHRGRACIGIQFKYDDQIKDWIKRLDFIHWSRTMTCFYMYRRPELVHRLLAHCKGRIWVDMIHLTSLNKVDRERKKKAIPIKEPHSLDSVVLAKINSVQQWMEQNRYADSTVKTYLSFIKKFFADHPGLSWDGLTTKLVSSYNHHRFVDRALSYSTQNQWINALKLYVRIHGLKEFSEEEIERPRKVRRLPDVLSKEEVRRLLQSIENKKHQCLLMLIYACGLRIGEALSLKINDVRSDEGLIYIRQGKGKKDRRVPLSKALLPVMRAYYKIHRPREYLFEGDGGSPYSPSSARQVLKRAVLKVGIKKRVTLHTLRHSYATHLTNRGVNIQYLQEILGHQSPKTTMLYTHLSGKDIRNITSPMDDLDL